MRRQSATPWDQLTAPARDGEALARPALDEWPGLVASNRRRREGYRFEILGRPFAELAGDVPPGPPVVMTGHQPTFIHPGVWVKGVAACRLAERVGGRAEFLIADTDVADHAALAVPWVGGGGCEARPHRLPAARSGLAFGQLPLVGREWWRAVEQDLDGGGLPEVAASPWRAFAEGYRQAAKAGPPAPGHVRGWASGLQAAHRALGLPAPRFTAASSRFDPGAGGEDDLAGLFIAHLLMHAEPLAAAYNTALRAYRTRRGIRGRQHPIPDLAVTADRVEAPLWIVAGGEPRRRLVVGHHPGGSIDVWVGETRVAALPADDLWQRPLRTLRDSLPGASIWPRALTLAMFLRLFACDLFIHGIGGAKYDQITDDIIRRFLGIEPPCYACLSATLRLPLPRSGRTEWERLHHVQQLRDLRYNPQRYLPPECDAEVVGLMKEREQLICTAESLRRRSPQARAARQAVWTAIRTLNARLAVRLGNRESETKSAIHNIARRLGDDRVAESREWFFAFHPRDRLLRLAEPLHYA